MPRPVKKTAASTDNKKRKAENSGGAEPDEKVSRPSRSIKHPARFEDAFKELEATRKPSSRSPDNEPVPPTQKSSPTKAVPPASPKKPTPAIKKSEKAPVKLDAASAKKPDEVTTKTGTSTHQSSKTVEKKSEASTSAKKEIAAPPKSKTAEPKKILEQKAKPTPINKDDNDPRPSRAAKVPARFEEAFKQKDDSEEPAKKTVVVAKNVKSAAPAGSTKSPVKTAKKDETKDEKKDEKKEEKKSEEEDEEFDVTRLMRPSIPFSKQRKQIFKKKPVETKPDGRPMRTHKVPAKFDDTDMVPTSPSKPISENNRF